MALAGTGLINAQLGNATVVGLPIGHTQPVVKYRPDSLGIFPNYLPYFVNRHFAFYQQHAIGLKQQGKTTAFPRPGRRYLPDVPFGGSNARDLTAELTLVLEKIQMPPTSPDRVMYAADSSTVPVDEFMAPLKAHINNKNPMILVCFKPNILYLPGMLQPQTESKYFFCIHPSIIPFLFFTHTNQHRAYF
jgi:hypothetical protein